ncbi:methionyl-tRNA formyltransferase [Bowmanella denitrificans]|uniref:Methionyl-tRNA formyltransferase n=1 Tax=Bowmanella denitrificans TaxID=366582 RepID=A0ABP3GVR1_9ALTE
MNKILKIGYFADGPWSHEAFNRIHSDQSFDIRFICVRYDTQDDTLKNLCKKNKITYLKNKNINSESFLSQLAEFDCDLFVSMSFNQIFKKNILNIPPLGIINCHAGKLPFYRGRNVLNWALINNESEFGVTVHFVDDGIDTGDIILQSTYPIIDSDDYHSLLQKAYVGCAETLYAALKMFISEEKVIGVKQKKIHPVGFYCTVRKPGDEIIDWNQTTRDVFNFIRAISSPGPNAITYLGEHEIQIVKAEQIKDAPYYKGIVGAVVGIGKDYFEIKTQDSFIRVIQYISPVKIMMGDRFKMTPTPSCHRAD